MSRNPNETVEERKTRIEQAVKNATVRRTMKIKNDENQKEFSVLKERTNKMNWKTMPEGSVIPNAGNSKEYKTGNWLPTHLHFNDETCIDCGLCWAVCPDDAIILDEGGHMTGIDYDHCKDCGLCVEVCPTEEKSLYFEEKSNPEI